jgi:hypothetical protein
VHCNFLKTLTTQHSFFLHKEAGKEEMGNDLMLTILLALIVEIRL